MEDGPEGIWFRTNQDDKADVKNRFEEVQALLESFNMIGTKIKMDLVEETSDLINRVSHNILSWLEVTNTPRFRLIASYLSTKHIGRETRTKVLRD